MPIAIRDKVMTNSQSYLEPGEHPLQAFVGQTINGWWGALTWLIVFKLRYRAVVVTDRRIIVFDTKRTASGALVGIIRQLPRQTQIGPVKGMWAKTETLGEKLYVHKRFHKDIQAADSAVGYPTA